MLQRRAFERLGVYFAARGRHMENAPKCALFTSPLPLKNTPRRSKARRCSKGNDHISNIYQPGIIIYNTRGDELFVLTEKKIWKMALSLVPYDLRNNPFVDRKLRPFPKNPYVKGIVYPYVKGPLANN